MDHLEEHLYKDKQGNMIVWAEPEEVPDYREAYKGYKVEYYDGHIYLMAPPSTVHNIVALNMVSALQRITNKSDRCRVFADNEGYFEYKNYTMPDVSMQCINKDGERELTVAVEVLSPSNFKGKSYSPLFNRKLARYKGREVRVIVLIDIENRVISLLEHPLYEKNTYAVGDSFKIFDEDIRVEDILNSKDLDFASLPLRRD